MAFLLTVVLALASLQFLNSNPADDNTTSERGDKTADREYEARGTTTTEPLPQQTHTSVLGSRAPYLNLVLILFLLLGAPMYFIAQFYGIEGLVQSAPDNGGKYLLILILSYTNFINDARATYKATFRIIF